MLDLVEELEKLVAALDEAGLDHALCGGLALAVHGFVRATVDIGLMVPADQIESAEGVARSLGFDWPAGPTTFAGGAVQMRRLSKEDPDLGDVLSVDFLVVTPAVAAMWATRARVSWRGGSLSVVSRRGLIDLKRLGDSGQDREDIAKLLEGGDDA